MRVHQHDVYTKRLVGQLAAALYLVSYPVRICSAGTDDAQAACITYCCSEVVVRNPGHTALDDRILDVQKFSQFRFHI